MFEQEEKPKPRAVFHKNIQWLVNIDRMILIRVTNLKWSQFYNFLDQHHILKVSFSLVYYELTLAYQLFMDYLMKEFDSFLNVIIMIFSIFLHIFIIFLFVFNHLYIYIYIYNKLIRNHKGIAQSARTVEYTDRFSAKG